MTQESEHAEFGTAWERGTRGLLSIRQQYRQLRVRTGCLNGLEFLWLEITRSCNLACQHCYVGSGPNLPLVEEMRLADWRRVMDEARSLGCRRLQFIGGEPTIHPGLMELIEHARSSGFKHCGVFTNATTLRPDLIDSFKKLRVRVALSFYSSDPETHDQITGQKGSFRKTVDSIEELVKRRISLRVAMILLDQNAAHVKQTKKFLRHLGVGTIETDRVQGIGRGKSLVPGARLMDELCGSCWAGKLCITASGDAYPCVFSRFIKVGNVLTDTVGDLVNGEALRAFRRVSYLGEEGGQG